MNGVSKVGSFQASWASMTSDSTVVDGNTATGPDTGTQTTQAQVTAGCDLGSIQAVTTINYTIGYQNASDVFILEYATNSSGPWTTISSATPPSHGGTFSLYSQTLTVSITARYLRLSLSELLLGLPVEVSVRELTVPSNVIMDTVQFQGGTEVDSAQIVKVVGGIEFDGGTQITAIAGLPHYARFFGGSQLFANGVLTSLSSSADYSVSGPYRMQVGVASTFTVKRLVNGAAANITVTVGPENDPSPATFALGTTAGNTATFTFTPVSNSTEEFTFTNSGGLSNPAPLNIGVDPSPTDPLPSPCGSLASNHSDYTIAAGGLPVTIPAGGDATCTFSVPNLPNAKYVDHYTFTATMSPIDDGHGNVTKIKAKFFSETDDSAIGAGTALPFGTTGIYIAPSSISPTFPMTGLIDHAGGTATCYLHNFNSYSVTISALSFIITTYNCGVRAWGADSFDDRIVAFAWASTAGNNNCLKVTHHKRMRSFISKPTQGWEAVDTLSAACVDDPSVIYLETGPCMVVTSVNNYRFAFVNQAMGHTGSWGTRQRILGEYWAPPNSYSDLPDRVSASGQSDRMVFTCGVGGIRKTGYNVVGHYQLLGERWGAGFVYHPNATWCENCYVNLQQNGNPVTKLTSYISEDGLGKIWTGRDQLSLPASYIPSGMVRLDGGTLVTILFDPSTGRSWGCHSNDRGATWTMAPSFSEVIPKLEVAPALTKLGDLAVACWVDGDDNPNFALSSDGGFNWD